MAQVALSSSFVKDLTRFDSPLRAKVVEMIAKLQRDHTEPGLHVEPYNAAADPRARTARVDLATRAILAMDVAKQSFILVKVLSHDQADRWMAKNRFNVNQLTGALEIIDTAGLTALAESAESPDETRGPDETPLGRIPDKAFTQLGITDPRVVAAARLMPTVEQVELLAGALPDDQAEALIGLASGMEVDEIYAGLIARLDTENAGAATIDPEDLSAAVERPASQSSFVILEEDDALLDALTQDFETWQIFLHPSQRDVVERTFRGPSRVSGGAGTGKTVALLHRAKRLASSADGQEPRVLVTTFTTKLRDDLIQRLRQLGGAETLSKITVSTVDALSRRVAVEAHGEAPQIVTGSELTDVCREAAGTVGSNWSPEFLLQEWEQVVLAQGITTRAQYFAVVRAGRGVRLSRNQRAEVWEVLEDLVRRLDGRRTFIQLAAHASAVLDAAAVKPYDHVLIDEAQDLHPAQWRLLRSSVAPGADDLFVAGDTHQRIYDHRVSLRQLGINVVGRSSQLRVNYRTTHEILRWALELLSGQTFDDLDDGEDSLQGYRSVTRGEAPSLTEHAGLEDELKWVLRRVEAWQKAGYAPNEIGVCTRTRRTAEMIRERLGHLVPTPYVGTMHGMKGLEFRAVIMADVSDRTVPLSPAVTPPDFDPRQNARDLQKERCLVYVAATRAREELAVSWHGEPSRFLRPTEV